MKRITGGMRRFYRFAWDRWPHLMQRICRPLKGTVILKEEGEHYGDAEFCWPWSRRRREYLRCRENKEHWVSRHHGHTPTWYYGRFPYVRTIRSKMGAVYHQMVTSEEDETKWLRMVKGIQATYPDAAWVDDAECAGCWASETEGDSEE